MIKNLTALGLFGGSSLNSAELAIIESDGVDVYRYGKTLSVTYPEDLIANIHQLIGHRGWTFDELENNGNVQSVREKISRFYAEIIKNFTTENKIDVIGIDGLTIFSDAADKCSYQLEDGHLIANLLHHDIITHFHKADLLSGGQAAPLTPAFFNMLGQNKEKPLLFIDLSAVSSLIYIGHSGELSAFDCAPGLAIIEDWCFRHARMLTDYNGKLAASGKVHRQIVESLLQHKILHRQPPKSLDILQFGDKKEHLEGLSPEDGAATATNFIAEAVFQAALDFLPAIPANIYIGGEGTKNPSLMRFIKQNFAPRQIYDVSIFNSEITRLGAQCTAFNAVRRMYKLPLTFPSTTGAYEPITGGEIYEANC